jgi:hypothetical protein
LKPEDKIKYFPFMLVFLGIIVWTHTISAFITLVSLFALVAGYILYEILYNRNILAFKSQNVQLLVVPLIFLAVIITYHWMDPLYPFFDQVLGGLLKSLSMEAEFLGATTVSNVHGRWEELLQPVGFCLYAFLGSSGLCIVYLIRSRQRSISINCSGVGSYSLFATHFLFWDEKYHSRPMACICVCLFRVIYWLGIFCALSLLKTKKAILCAVAMFFFIGSTFMITGGATNQDSPLYGEEVFLKMIWTESEMNMYAHINETYDGRSLLMCRPFHDHKRISKKSKVNSLSYFIGRHGGYRPSLKWPCCLEGR